MKRMMVTGIFESEEKKISALEGTMYHGEYGIENHKLVLYKNIELLSPMFMPTSWFVVQGDFIQNFLKMDDISFKKLNFKTFSLKMIDFEKFTKKYERFYTSGKTALFYKKYIIFSNLPYEFYGMVLPRVSDFLVELKDKISVKANGLETEIFIDKNKIEIIHEYSAFNSSRFTFFKQEVFDLVLPLIDERYFYIKEVDIPIEQYRK